MAASQLTSVVVAALLLTSGLTAAGYVSPDVQSQAGNEPTSTTEERTSETNQDRTSSGESPETDTFTNGDVGSLSYGETVDGVAPSSGTQQVTFSARRGDVFTVEAEATSPITLELVGPYDNVVATSSGTNPEIEYTYRRLERDLTVRVSGDGTGERVEYSLSLERVENIEARDIDSISYGETKESVIGDTDRAGTDYPQYYERVNFTAEQGDVITIDAASETANLAVELRGPYGRTYINPTQPEDISEFVLNRSGEYTIRVYGGDEPEIDRYTISLEKDGEAGYFDLREIAYGETKRGAVGEEDRAGTDFPNFYEPVNFTGERGDVVTITAASDTIGVALALVGPNGETEVTPERSAAISEYALPRSGEYTIRVYGDENMGFHNYTLSVEKVDESDGGSSGGDDGSDGDGSSGSTGGEDSSGSIGGDDSSGSSDGEDNSGSSDGDDSSSDGDDASSVGDGDASNSGGEDSTSGQSDGGAVAENGSLALDARASETIDGDAVRFTIEANNTADEPRAVLVDFDPVLASLPEGWTVVGRTDNGGVWRAAENAWLFQNVQPGGSVEAAVALEPPADASGEYSQTVPARTNSSRVTDSASFRVQDTSLLAAVDRNDDGRIGDGEILAAIEWWRTDSAVADTDLRISNRQILQLSELWQEGGTYR